MLAVLLYDQKRTRHSSFAPFCLPASSLIALNGPCRSEGRQSAASDAKLLAALPRSFAAASGLHLKTKALLYSRALFFPCCQFSDKALCTFWSRSGSLHGAACSVLAEQRRNEAISSRAGGRRLAVRRYRLATSGLLAAEYSSGG